MVDGVLSAVDPYQTNDIPTEGDADTSQEVPQSEPTTQTKSDPTLQKEMDRGKQRLCLPGVLLHPVKDAERKAPT